MYAYGSFYLGIELQLENCGGKAGGWSRSCAHNFMVVAINVNNMDYFLALFSLI